MKLLFLDIDGVIWTVGGCILARQNNSGKERSCRLELDPVAMALVGELIKENDFKVVVSSTWRLGSTIEQLKEILGPVIGAAVIAVTPCHKNGYRGGEIKSFLDNWNEFYRGGPVDEFIILDDDRDMNPIMGHLFWTDSYNGFTARNLMEVERYLKSSPFKKKLTRIKKTIRYNVDRKIWRILLPMKWKLQRWFKILFVTSMLAGCTYKPTPDICQAFDNGKVIIDKPDNYCVLKFDNGLFTTIPCSVAKTCYPEKFEDKNVSR